MAPVILLLSVAAAGSAGLYALDPDGFATPGSAAVYVLFSLALGLKLTAVIGRGRLRDLVHAEIALRSGKWPSVLASVDALRARIAGSPGLLAWAWAFTFRGPEALARHIEMVEAQAKYELHDLAGARAALAPALALPEPDWRARLLAARCALEQGEREEAIRLATGDSIPPRLRPLADKLKKDAAA